MLALAVALVAAAGLLSAEAVTCGTWKLACQPFYPNAGGNLNTYSVTGSIQFDGLLAGNYTWIRRVYAASSLACTASTAGRLTA